MSKEVSFNYSIEKYPALMNRSVWLFPSIERLPTRARNVLEKRFGDYCTVSVLLQLDVDRLREIPRVGPGIVEQIRRAIDVIKGMTPSACEDMLAKDKDNEGFLEEMERPIETTSKRCDAITDVVDEFVDFMQSRDYKDALAHFESFNKFSTGMSTLMIFMVWLKYRETLPKATDTKY